jgi:hypothetical protein
VGQSRVEEGKAPYFTVLLILIYKQSIIRKARWKAGPRM